MKQIVLERFFDHVRKNGDHIAVQDPNNGALTFRELAMWSEKVYQYLKRKGIGREDFVVICIPRGIFVIAAMLGVMRAGAAFTIVEEGVVPEERIQYIIKDCNAKIIIDSECWKDIEREELTEAFSGFDYCEIDLHDAAYAVYTSGSTGQPKGCLQEYGIYECAMKSHAYFENDDKGLFANIISADRVAFINHSIACIVPGVTMDIVPLYLLREPAALLEYFTKQHVTYTLLSPTLLKMILGTDLNLKFVLLVGEPARNIFIDNSQIVNAYASSEGAGNSFNFRIDRPYEEIPIGKPAFDFQYKIRSLTDNENDTGELMIKLPYFRGYINLPELTKRVLVDGWYHTGDVIRKLEDGNLVLLGRIDNMLKINGNRVEPEEIEAAAIRILGLQDAVVKAYSDEEHTRLCLFYVNASELDSHEASALLAKYLPYYMLPNQYVRLEQLPRLPTGKVDRAALEVPELSKNSTTRNLPRDELEAALCKAFAKALNLDDFSVDDDFYLLGGDSLRTVTAIEESNVPGLNMYDMLNGRTPQKIAEHYRIRIAKENQDVEAENLKAMQKSHPLTAWQQHVLNYRLLKPNSTLFDSYGMFRFSKRMDVKRLEEAVNKMCHAHPALMTILSQESDGSLKQSYHPELYIPVKTEYVSDEEFARLRETLVKPIDIYGGLLYSLRLFSTETADYIFLQISHSISDGTSFKIIFADILKAYRGESLMTDCYYLMLEMKEQQKTTSFYKEAEEYYKQRYGKRVYDTRPKDDGDGENLGNEFFVFSLKRQADKIKQMSDIHMISENVFFATALGLSVAVYNGCNNVLTAWAYNGRKSAMDSNIVGMCYKNLPLALELTSEITLSEIYADVRNQVIKDITYDCYAYNIIDVPLIKGDKALMLFQKGIYDSMEDVQNNVSILFEYPPNSYDKNCGALDFEVIPVDSESAVRTANYNAEALDFEAISADLDTAICIINYNSDMYRETSVHKFTFIFTQVVTLMLDRVEDKEFTFGMLREHLCKFR